MTQTSGDRVAVVGAGPSGFYAAEALLRARPGIRVDLFERLPVPFGLVRFGVAPDHQKLKQVTAVFEKIAAMPGFRLVGGASVGENLSLEELRAAYHAVILATGAPKGRALGIPGEDLAGSHSASDFVGWYNGHPDHRDLVFDLSAEKAVVIGHGNVALDVARLLLKTPDELRSTDIAAHALEVLAESRVREVHIVGRGGPSATRFSPKELGEFGALADCDPALVLEDFAPDALVQPADTPPERRIAVELLQSFAAHVPSKRRRCVFRFNLSPLAIEGDGRVRRILLRRTTGDAASLGETVGLDCGFVLSSIGRRSEPIAGVPFDTGAGRYAHREGRVVDGDAIVPRLYACGWCKRGPQGTIGTNRACATQTVGEVLADLSGTDSPTLANPAPLLARIAAESGAVLDFAAWKRIDAIETEAGQRAGKPREKLASVEAMLAATRRERVV